MSKKKKKKKRVNILGRKLNATITRIAVILVGVVVVSDIAAVLFDMQFYPVSHTFRIDKPLTPGGPCLKNYPLGIARWGFKALQLNPRGSLAYTRQNVGGSGCQVVKVREYIPHECHQIDRPQLYSASNPR